MADPIITWRAPGRAKERILAYGSPGTGKTRAYLEIARRCPDATFWILDNDASIERMLETEFDDLAPRMEYRGDGEGAFREDGEYSREEGNLMVFYCNGWKDHEAMLDRWERQANRHDWLCVDTGTRLWDDVQGFYTQTVFGKDLSDYLLEFKVANTTKDSGKATTASEAVFADWQFINPLYMSKVTNRILNPPSHVFIVHEQTQLTDMDSKETKSLYGAYGTKPKGQKKAGHITHTVLNFRKSNVGDYKVTTIKDRGREELVDQAVEDFAKDYLWKVAGWRPRKVEQ